MDADGSVFCVDSSAGAYVTGGKSYKVTNNGFTFIPKEEDVFDPSKMTFTMEGNIGSDSHLWSLSFATKQGDSLAVGMYKNASRYPFQVATQPGLNFSGDGRENNQIEGYFEILDIEYNAENKLQRFAANFLQYGEKQQDKKTLGKIRYKSTIPLSTNSDFPIN